MRFPDGAACQYEHDRPRDARRSGPGDCAEGPAILLAELSAPARVTVPVPEVLQPSTRLLIEPFDLGNLVLMIRREPHLTMGRIRPRPDHVRDDAISAVTRPVAEKHAAGLTRGTTNRLRLEQSHDVAAHPQFALLYALHASHRECFSSENGSNVGAMSRPASSLNATVITSQSAAG